jgi:hypothetical protein
MVREHHFLEETAVNNTNACGKDPKIGDKFH